MTSGGMDDAEDGLDSGATCIGTGVTAIAVYTVAGLAAWLAMPR